MTDRVVRIDLGAVDLYHGGARGLAPGTILLPPMSTGAPAAARPDKVYLTVDLDYARFHAAMYAGRTAGGRVIVGRGTVYLVEALAALEHDDGEEPGYSFMVNAAKVIGVVERHVRFPQGIEPGQVADELVKRGGLPTRTLAGMGARTLALGRA
jgi:hypothetical protein